jgi:hypothetical protein
LRINKISQQQHDEFKGHLCSNQINQQACELTKAPEPIYSMLMMTFTVDISDYFTKKRHLTIWQKLLKNNSLHLACYWHKVTFEAKHFDPIYEST